MKKYIATALLVLCGLFVAASPEVLDGEMRYRFWRWLLSQNNDFSGVNTFALLTADEVRLTSDTAWDDLRFPATGVNPVGPADAATPDTTTPGLIFSGTAENVVHIVAQHSHAKKLGTAVCPHMHIQSTGTSTNATVWHMIYQWKNLGETLGATWTTNSVIYNPPGVANKHELVEFSDINAPASETVSSVMQIRLVRAATNPADNNTDTLRLLEYDIHYQIDGFGSDSETAKSY